MRKNGEKMGGDPHEQATAQAVAILNAEARKSAGSWLVMGKAIADYVATTSKADGDAFRILSRHPDCLLGASSLRAYYTAWKLHGEIAKDGNPPEADYTAWVVVSQAAGLNYQVRKTLLQDAQKNQWSIAELKEAIARIRQGSRPDPTTEEGGDPSKPESPAVDWKATCKSLEHHTTNLIENLTFLFSLQPKGEVSSALRQNIQKVIRLLIVHHLIEREFILDNMPEEKGEVA